MGDITLGIVLLVFSVFLIAAILLQSSKSHKLPGTIAGGAETFFGKTKGSKLDRILSIATAVVAIAFCVIVLMMYVTQESLDYDEIRDGMTSTETVEPTGSPDLGTTETGDATTETGDATTESGDATTESGDATTESGEANTETVEG